MSQQQKVIQELLFLKKNNIVEFHYLLRQTLYNCNVNDFDYFSDLIKNFYETIIKSGVFYITILNKNIFLYFKLSLQQDPELQERVIRTLVSMLEDLSSIANYETLQLLKNIAKKLSLKFSSEKHRVEVLIKYVFHSISRMEQALSKMELQQEKDFIIKWY